MRVVSTGARIRERRLAEGVAQAALARDAGISPSYLNLIEHDRRPIGGALLNRIADILAVPVATLSEDSDEAAIADLRAAGASLGLRGAILDEAASIARRHPEWATAFVQQADSLAAQARTIEALSDRLTNDPTLANALHELLSTVSVVRSTAAILAQTPDIDRNWLGRFHANLDADSRRLAEGAEAVVSYFDSEDAERGSGLLPAEIAARFLDSAASDRLEAEGVAAIPDLVAELDDPMAASLAAAALAEAAQDAARLPTELVDAVETPEDLVAVSGGDLALVLRRMGHRKPGRGLVVCDAAGAIIHRRTVRGFALPVMGAGCPLWPLYEALSQPGRPLRVGLVTPDGARWLAHAIAQAEVSGGFDGPPVLRATMLLTRADATAEEACRSVGPSCRVCPRPGCPARREPSILSGTPDAGLDLAHRTENTRAVL
ncbi:MAG: short-chain fatty acyl-CoA regulator family protein [Pseudomonadota bacterium]